MVVRVRDSTGIWSLPETRTFTIKDTVLSSIKTEKTGSNFNVFPNPVLNELNVEFKIDVPSKSNIEIYDNTGRLVYEGKFENLIVGDNQVSLNISNLKPGVYMLNLNTTNRNNSSWFIKQ
jgi:hypothetical protein